MKKEKQLHTVDEQLIEKVLKKLLEKSVMEFKKDKNKTNSIDCSGEIIRENDIVAFTSKRAKLAREKFDCIGIVKFADYDGKKDFIVEETTGYEKSITLLDYADEFLIKIVKGEY